MRAEGIRKNMIGAFVVVLVGILTLPAFQQLDHGGELAMLFRLRDRRDPPPEAVIVSINRHVSTRFGVPIEPDRWPRKLHVELVNTLVAAGATGIVFDLAFEREAAGRGDDTEFAAAMKRSGRVALCGRLEVDAVEVPDGLGRTVKARVERLRPPVPALREAAVGVAPFPLPKIPVTVDRYWTFKTGAGNLPTLPVLAFHIYAGPTFNRLMEMITSVEPRHARLLPRPLEGGGAATDMQEAIRSVRECFESDPGLAGKLRDRIGSDGSGLTASDRRRLEDLIDLYEGPSSRHLNLYGPPGTVATIPLDLVVQPPDETNRFGVIPDLRGKVVFVGVSDTEATGSRDGFHTAFSQASGVDIAGVELAATAFCNLVDGTAVRPMPFLMQVLLVAVWGVVVGAVCRILPAPIAAAAVLALGTVYIIWADYAFSVAALWMPLIVPLAVQAPVGFFGIVWWKYAEAQRTRKRMEESARRYLPEHVVERLSHEYVPGTRAQVAHGACLYSDVERYTALSERLDPAALAALMNRYYDTALEPIQTHGGRVSHIAGDSALAIWLAGDGDTPIEMQACLAGLGMASAVERFNHACEHGPLNTRIGLHAGEMGIGEIGGRQRVTYTAVGDIVNTAARIQDLNRHLGTRVLVSDAGLTGCKGLLSRRVGTFLLVGKATPIVVHELMCLEKDADSTARTVCALFAHGLEAYRNQSWDEAMEAFLAARQVVPGDGPSTFYLNECRRMLSNPPDPDWRGVVKFTRK